MHRRLFVISLLVLIAATAHAKSTKRSDQEEEFFDDEDDQQQQQQATPSRKSTDVAKQGNEENFRRGSNEAWEGDDEELTPSQEAGMIAPRVAWKVIKKRQQVPYIIDEAAKFSAKDKRKIEKHMKAAAKKIKVDFKKQDFETYYLLISSLKACIAGSMKKQQQKYNEIPVCLEGASDVYSEIYRATTIGMQVNKQMRIEMEGGDNSDGDGDEDSEDETQEEDDDHDDAHDSDEDENNDDDDDDGDDDDDDHHDFQDHDESDD
jgi:hypothetical protein